jgi:transposase
MLPSPRQPNAENCSLTDLETAILCAPTQRRFVRMMAIRTMLVLGLTCEQVAVLVDKTRRAISTWIRHFNQAGIDGLIESDRSGRPKKISDEQGKQYEVIIQNPEKQGKRIGRR